MAYSSFINGFKVTTKSAIDQRILLSKAEMLEVSNDKKYVVPALYFALCTDDHKFYLYCKQDSQHPFNTETGYYHPLEEYLDFTTTEAAKENIAEAIQADATVQDIQEQIYYTDPETGEEKNRIEELETAVESLVMDGGEIGAENDVTQDGGEII